MSTTTSSGTVTSSRTRTTSLPQGQILCVSPARDGIGGAIYSFVSPHRPRQDLMFINDNNISCTPPLLTVSPSYYNRNHHHHPSWPVASCNLRSPLASSTRSPSRTHQQNQFQFSSPASSAHTASSVSWGHPLLPSSPVDQSQLFMTEKQMKPDHIPLVSHDHQYFYQQDLQQQQQQQMVFSDHAPARLFTSARANLFDLHRNNRHFRGELNNESRTGYAEEDEDEEEEEGENLDGVDQDDQEEEEKEEKEEMLDECEEEKCCLNASTQHHLHIYSDHQ